MISWMNNLSDGDILHAVHIHSIVQAISGKYVESGCNVTVDSELTVIVNSGYIRYNGVEYEVIEESITLSPAQGSIPRVDLIVWDYNSGEPVVKVIEGTEVFIVDNRMYPVAPNIIDEQIPLALVVVSPWTDSLSEDDIYDLRVTGHTHNISDIVFNSSLVPTVDAQYSIGSSSYRLSAVYSKDIYGEWCVIKKSGDLATNKHIASFGREGSPDSGNPDYQLYIGGQGGDKENVLVFTGTDSTVWKDLLGLDFDNNAVHIYASDLILDGMLDVSGAGNLDSLQIGGTEVITSGRVLQNVTADASIITSGVLDLDRIPSIDWSRISGNFPRSISDVISSAFSRSWISDLFSSPFWDSIPDKPFDTLGSEFTVSSGELQIASVLRSKISDFFSTPFWDNIPDKPFEGLGSEFTIDGSNNLVIDSIDFSKVVNRDSSMITFNSSIIPDVDNTYSLGISSYRWKNAYFAGIVDVVDVSINGSIIIDNLPDWTGQV